MVRAWGDRELAALDSSVTEWIVTRTRDTADRRVIRLALTDAGHDRLEALRQVMDRCDVALRSVLDEAEGDALQGALDKVFAVALAELHAGDPVAFPADAPTAGPSPLAPNSRSTS